MYNIDIDISYNNIEDYGAKAIAQALETNYTLKDLSILFSKAYNVTALKKKEPSQ